MKQQAAAGVLVHAGGELIAITSTAKRSSDLPRYAPELNDPPVEPEGRRERSWRDLERHYLAQRTSREVWHLDHTIHTAVHNLNHERATPMGASFPRAA